jgi:hypothetical protein
LVTFVESVASLSPKGVQDTAAEFDEDISGGEEDEEGFLLVSTSFLITCGPERGTVDATSTVFLSRPAGLAGTELLAELSD